MSLGRRRRRRIARDRGSSDLSLLQFYRHFTSIFFGTTLVSPDQYYVLQPATTGVVTSEDSLSNAMRRKDEDKFSELETIALMSPVSSRSTVIPLPLEIKLSTQCCPAIPVFARFKCGGPSRRRSTNVFFQASVPETSSPTSSLGLPLLLPKKVTRFEAHSSRGKVLEFVYLFQTEISPLPPLFPYLLPCSQPFFRLDSSQGCPCLTTFDVVLPRLQALVSRINNNNRFPRSLSVPSPLSLSNLLSYSRTIGHIRSSSRIKINQSRSQSKRCLPLDLFQLFVESLLSSPLRDLDVSPLSRLAKDPNLP